MKKKLIYLLCLCFSIISFAKDNNQKVSLIIKNGTILTMNEDHKIIEDGVVIIDKNKIIAIGDKEILKEYSATLTLDAQDGIVMPGMINTHTHAAMTIFRSIGDDVGDRLNRYLFPLESKLVTPTLVYDGTRHGAIEMLKGGVTTMVDMYYFEDQAAKALKELGMRGIMGETIMAKQTPDAKKPYGGIDIAIKLTEKYKEDELITPAFAPHATYSNDSTHLQKIQSLALKYDVPVMMHVAETQAEVDKYKAEYGMTPIQYLQSIGLLTNKLIAAHCIFVDDNDIELLSKNDVGVSHNMSANIKSAKGVSPSLKMFDNGIRIGLGTDGPMSSNSLDIIAQMGYVAKVQKLINKDRTVMPAKKVVEMATLGGAKAIHMEDKLGSLEVGKLADIVIVETQSANMTPTYNPYSSLVYSAHAGNVETVIINGKIIVNDKKLLTFDENKDRENIKVYRHKVEKIAGILK